jgi:hypothetical protein
MAEEVDVHLAFREDLVVEERQELLAFEPHGQRTRPEVQADDSVVLIGGDVEVELGSRQSRPSRQRWRQ